LGTSGGTGSGSVMGYLTQGQIIDLTNAVIGQGLDYTQIRNAYMTGINPHFRAILPSGLPPMPQLMSDIGQLAQVDRLVDGQVPLRIWLANAVALAGMTEHSTVFQRALDDVDHRATGAPRFDPISLPESKEVIVHQDDMVSFTFVKGAIAAAASVARLSVPRFEAGQQKMLNSGVPSIYLGTGWLLTPDLLITNHHVVNARNENEPPAADPDLKLQGGATKVKFDFDADGMQGEDISVTTLEAWNEELDYAVLRLPATGRAGLVRAPTMLQAKKGDYIPVNIIQHPEGASKKFAIRNNLVTAATATDLRYFTDTRRGSSGSPVFDDQWRVVALHRGATLAEDVKFQGQNVAWVNVGTQLSAVITDLKARAPAVAASL